ncbi:MAG: hypothetical protein KatS3mg002_0779 [Candidatus Woesearchaeota archaeon]|nr:MAG: hypothetical protein KatS3mg002_0779 [Candidatus Woesearchaeota archaeon]
MQKEQWLHIKKISAPYSKVLRDGEEKKIPSKEIVPGDVVLLEEGDIVPADMRLIEATRLHVDESSLTGESNTIKKKSVEQLTGELTIHEQSNMLFMGTIVTLGVGKGIVTATGMRTEFGKIAGSIQEIKEQATPLQVKFEKMAKQLSAVVLILVAVVFVLGFLNMRIGLVELFMFSLSLAVAAVPTSLPAIVTISLGLGAKRLAGKNMIIKKLPAAESLGAVTVICSDKTGTITKNQMTVTKIYSSKKIIDVTGSGYIPEGDFFYEGKKLSKKDLNSLEVLFRIGYLCNNAKLINNNNNWSIIGDSTEGSLIVLSKKSLDESYFEQNFEKIEEIPFDSDRKLMSVIYENLKTKKNRSICKGCAGCIA